jgi:hypothetical protein
VVASLEIEFERQGVGRIRVRSHTRKARVKAAMLEMLRTLYEVGRADVLRDIKAGRVDIMDVYEKYRTGRLEHLPTGTSCARWRRRGASG